jgi:hypothetical protein
LGEDDDPRAGVALARHQSAVDSLALERRRHPDVGDDHVRRELLCARDQLGVISGDADHVHIVSRTQQRAQPLAHDEAVVGEQNADSPHV